MMIEAAQELKEALPDAVVKVPVIQNNNDFFCGKVSAFRSRRAMCICINMMLEPC